MIPLIGVSIAERLRDRGFDRCIRSDDLSKHSRSYRQTSPLQNKIPSRDAVGRLFEVPLSTRHS